MTRDGKTDAMLEQLLRSESSQDRKNGEVTNYFINLVLYSPNSYLCQLWLFGLLKNRYEGAQAHKQSQQLAELGSEIFSSLAKSDNPALRQIHISITERMILYLKSKVLLIPPL